MAISKINAAHMLPRLNLVRRVEPGAQPTALRKPGEQVRARG
jgi:hypothetical protein